MKFEPTDENLDEMTTFYWKDLILHWLIESIPEGFWSLFSMPDGI